MYEIHFKLPNNDTQVRDLVGTIPQFGGKWSYITGIVMNYFSTGEILTATYSQSQNSRNFKLYSDGKFVGHVFFNWRRTLTDGTFGTDTYPLAGYNPGITYRLEPRVSHVYIDKLEVNDSDRNAGYGTLLLRLTMEWGLSRECGARTLLNAYKNSHWWYHRHGFRAAETHLSSQNGWKTLPPRESVDHAIANEIVRAKKAGETPDTTALSANYFFSLPEWACWKWITLIRSEPLLTNVLPPPKDSISKANGERF